MKRTKKITATLKEIAKSMPRQEYQFLANQVQQGHDLIQKGQLEDGENKPILPHKTYVKKIPITGEVNHLNRMKSAFDSNGIVGVKTYLKPFIKPELQGDFLKRVESVLC